MEPALSAEVWERAGNACEYCHMPQDLYRVPFQTDHVIAQQHGGQTLPDNLALACLHCNKHKGPNITSIDPETRALAPLFHPRKDCWRDHFHWEGVELIGRTPCGRATIRCLAINHPDYLAVRTQLLREGIFPPTA